jgi:DDE superfamily endonuclease
LRHPALLVGPEYPRGNAFLVEERPQRGKTLGGSSSINGMLYVRLRHLGAIRQPRLVIRVGAAVFPQDYISSKHRNLAAAKRFFRSAKAFTGVTPDRVTTDGHKAHPRAIRSEPRTSFHLNNRLEQDHRGIKGRCCFKSVPSARRYCRGHDELRNFLRSLSRMCQHVPAATRRFHHMRRTAITLGILEAA